MTSIKKNIYDAVKGHYTAERDKAITNIRIHVENPVGVGEHPKIVEDVIALVHQASEAQDSIDMLDEIFNTDFDA
jgi:hypothetical protein|tara:strand:- start:970 stop:1194 length:225 start_codon:yes stop_codon:yes gene_type:complete